jgi:hypothetical protein
VLDCKRVSVHGHDYPDLRRFLGRLTESHGNPAYERTVFLLLGEETLAVPHGFYRATLKRFETPTALSDYLDSLPERAGFDRRAHGRLVERLVREGGSEGDPGRKRRGEDRKKQAGRARAALPAGGSACRWEGV